MPTIQELRAGLARPVSPSEVVVKRKASHAGKGAYVEPYDGPMGTDDRTQGKKAPANPDDTYGGLGRRIRPK